MTISIRRRRSRGFIVAIAVLAAAAAASGQIRPSTRETAGWIDAGRKVAVGDLERRGLPAPAGRFEVFTTSKAARALLASRDTLWIGTEGGLFFRAADADSIMRAKGPAFTAVSTIARGDGGDLWVGGAGGVSIRRPGGWKHWTRRDHPFFSDVTDIRPGDGKIWISTWGAGCGFIRRDSLTVITRIDSLLDDRVTCVVEENSHTIWIGTESGICRADSFSWRSLRYGSRIPVGRARDLAFDEEGGLFIAVARQGAARYSLGRVSVFGPVQGLPSLDVMRFGADSSGRLLAVGAGGASAWDGSGWTPVQIPLPGSPVRELLAVAHDIEGDTYLGTGDGRCVIISREGVRAADLPQRFPESTVTALAAADRGLWLSGLSGVYRIGGRTEHYPLPGEWFYGAVSGIVPESGGVWLSTRFGILRLRGGSWEIFDRRQGLPTEHFIAAAGAGPDIWFATFDRGVLRLGDEGWVHYTKRHGLPGEDIAALQVDAGGTPWIATRSGHIARFDGGEWEVLDLPVRGAPRDSGAADSADAAEPVIRYLDGPGGDAGRRGRAVLGTDAAGNVLIAAGSELYFQASGEWRAVDLPGAVVADEVTCCSATREGAFLVGTRDDGVFVLGGDRWLHADDSSGLGGRSVTAMAVDREGTVWIATAGGGLTRYEPAAR